MRHARHFLRSLPGHVAALLAVVVTTVAGVVGAQSLFYEGWGQPAWVVLAHLVPWAACLTLCLVALQWPRAGGMLLVAVAIGGGTWWLAAHAEPGGLSAPTAVTALVLFTPVVGLGGLFLLEARHRRLLRSETPPPAGWWARNHRAAGLVAVSLLGLGTVTADKLPERLARHDDGLRGARVVEANGVRLVWAPAGPGWSWRQPDGELPSWGMIATYGAPPLGMKAPGGRDESSSGLQDMERVGLCAFLDDAGTTLLTAPAHLWRMPTADEIVRSLTRDGANAGCVWDGQATHAACRRPPDKETPLWAPDEAPIYILSSDVADGRHVLGVNYTGGITPHLRTARGQSYRCVKPLP